MEVIKGTARFCMEKELNCEKSVDLGDSHVGETVKKEVVEWCRKVLKLQKMGFEEFVGKWTDGVWICRLVKELFKGEEFKFYDRPPLSATQVRINFKKTFKVIRNCVKFKSEFIYCDREIMNGDEGATWGLLFDLKNWALNKISAPGLIKLALDSDFLKEKSENLLSRPSVSYPPPLPFAASPITITHIKKSKEWLIKLGIHSLVNIDNGHFFQNPYKNGMILNEVLKKLNFSVEFNEEAHTKDEVLQNLTNILRELKRVPGLSTVNLTPNSLICGDEEAIWGLLFNLSQVFPKPAKPSLNLYNAFQKKDLLESLGKWTKGLGVARGVEEGLSKEIVFETVWKLFADAKNFELETLKRVFGIDELFDLDFEEEEICLLFLENLHRYVDSVPLQLERDCTYPVYIGRGL